jgi:hypothetical protein
MTARRLTATFLFALTLTSAFALSGCGLFSSEEQPPPAPAAKALTVQQAEDAVRSAEKKLAAASQAAQDARAKADQAKQDADMLEARARRIGVDTNDPASRTAKARVVQKQAEDDAVKAAAVVDTARRELDAARAGLEAARPGPNPGPMPAQAGSEGWTDYVFSWLLPAVGASVALVILSGLFWLTWRKLEAVHAKNEDVIRTLAMRQDEKLVKLDVVASRVKDMEHRLDALQDDIFRLKRTVEAPAGAWARESRPEDSRNAARVAPAAYEPAEEGYAEEDVDFPATANSFLTRFGAPWQVVKPDWMRNLLVKDPDGRGTFVLIRDAGVPGGQLCIIPRITRFIAAEDFHNHYEQFYDCAHPAAGEVWVNTPAVVMGVDGGWRLLERGELEVRA